MSERMEGTYIGRSSRYRRRTWRRCCESGHIQVSCRARKSSHSQQRTSTTPRFQVRELCGHSITHKGIGVVKMRSRLPRWSLSAVSCAFSDETTGLDIKPLRSSTLMYSEIFSIISSGTVVKIPDYDCYVKELRRLTAVSPYKIWSLATIDSLGAFRRHDSSPETPKDRQHRAFHPD